MEMKPEDYFQIAENCTPAMSMYCVILMQGHCTWNGDQPGHAVAQAPVFLRVLRVFTLPAPTLNTCLYCPGT